MRSFQAFVGLSIFISLVSCALFYVSGLHYCASICIIGVCLISVIFVWSVYEKPLRIVINSEAISQAYNGTTSVLSVKMMLGDKVKTLKMLDSKLAAKSVDLKSLVDELKQVKSEYTSLLGVYRDLQHEKATLLDDLKRERAQRTEMYEEMSNAVCESEADVEKWPPIFGHDFK